MTFDEIMTYSPRNKTNYEQLVEVFDTVIPFVGAGLSAGIMPTWKAALRSMCNSISTEIEKKRLLDQINKDVFKAAASLEEYFGTLSF